MKTIIFPYIISIVLFLLTKPIFCQLPQFKNVSNEFFEIKYEELIKQKNNVKLSQIASKVEYVRLETNGKCLIYYYANYYFTDDYIFVSNKDHILKFTSDGKFVKKIGNPGRGPGEILSIRLMSIIPEKKYIIVHDAVQKKMIYYSFDGNFIKTVNIPQGPVYLKVMKDGNYIAVYQFGGAHDKYTHTLINESGDILSSVKNDIPLRNQIRTGTAALISSFIPFYTYQNRYYLKSLYNDTIYVINSNKIVPSYSINLGKFRLPQEKRFESLSGEEARTFQKDEAFRYCFVYVLESGGKIFLISNNYGNKKIEHFLIEKNGFLRKSNDRYLNVYRNYILNDWDGGMFFWPAGSINDNKVFMPVDIKDLKDILKVTASAKKPFIFPEQQKQLARLASDLDITDNPILMVVTLKDNN